jgi:multiple sugar transport system permease protein
MKSVRRFCSYIEQREGILGYIYASPWIFGFIVFGVVPIFLSFYYSFCRYDVLRPPMFVGFANYKFLLFESPNFYKSIYNTFYYTVFRVPIVIVGSLLIAMLVARPMPGVYTVRTLYYLPSIVSGVALSVIWMWLYNPQYGLVNQFLGWFGIPGPLWLQSEKSSKFAIVFMGLWSVGGGRMIIFIAGLNSIPRELYESAAIDGARWWSRFRHITIPQISSILFLLTLVEIISSFQVFTEAYVMTQGGPLNSTLFYNLELYNKSFLDYQMGTASAMAWLLFLFTLGITLFLFKVVGSRVYYEYATPK